MIEVTRPRLGVITASTRPNRVGRAVADWFIERVQDSAAFDVEDIDLAVVDLPLMDETFHPRLRRYEHAHTQSWSKRVDALDAVVWVMPEYNNGFTAPVKNALDFLSQEWAYKPVAFVTYGGVAAGTRAAQMMRQVVVPLKMVAIPETVAIPFVDQFVGADGAIVANSVMEAAATALCAELLRVEGAMRPLRRRSGPDAPPPVDAGRRRDD